MNCATCLQAGIALRKESSVGLPEAIASLSNSLSSNLHSSLKSSPAQPNQPSSAPTAAPKETENASTVGLQLLEAIMPPQDVYRSVAEALRDQLRG